jgi:hypothetical protein
MFDAASEQTATELYVDAHVHVYPCMSVAAVLDAAARNLLRGRPASPPPAGVLLVADPDGVPGYARLAGDAIGPRWQRVQADGRVVSFLNEAGVVVAALPGRQLVSEEGLEVLGAGCGERVRSGRPLGELVESIRAAGGLALLAWGVGKWLGRRGRVLDRVIAEQAGRRDVMLADNAGRPGLWSHVPQFAAATECGLRVLAGTDPLPFAGEERRIGSYGFRVRVPTGPGDAPRALRRALETPEVPIEIVGRRVSARDFVAGQLKLRTMRMWRGGTRP